MAVFIFGFIGAVFCYPSDGVMVSAMDDHKRYSGVAAISISP
jgi:hypothetical protein